MSESGTVLHLQKMTGIAGSENFLFNLGQGLYERGWQPYLGLIEEKASPVDEVYQHFSSSQWTVRRFAYRKGLLLTLLPRLKRWINRVTPDLINTHLLHADLLGGLASIGLELPLVTTKHNDDRYKYLPGYSFFARILNSRFDRIVTISDHLKDFYERTLGVSHRPCRRIYYGLDPDRFLSNSSNYSRKDPILSAKTNQKYTFGIVARLIEQKGVDVLVRAFSKVVSANQATHLVITGSGPKEDELRNQVRELNLTGRVTFTGHREDVVSILNVLDCFTHPSRWEGFGLTLLEAMAARLPIVATNVSAIPEIVQNEVTGLLVPSDNPAKLAEAMTQISSRADGGSSLGEAGRRRLEEKFSLETMIEEYDQFYREIIQEK